MISLRQEIVIVEDEIKIAHLLRDYLSNVDYKVTMLHEGTRAVQTIMGINPACVILDLMLPGKDGLQICRELRENSDVPIVMITARVDEIDRLLGLELGADDYICKPFSPREVVVRIRNILRRVARTSKQSSVKDEAVLEYASLILDSEKFYCELDGSPVTLTTVEFRMLLAMTRSAGRIFSRSELMLAAYSDGRIVSDRTIDSHIKNLRKKLTIAATDDIIHSVYGVGYKVE